MTQPTLFGDLSRVTVLQPGSPLPEPVDVALLPGDAAVRLAELGEATVDAIVTDPPGALHFMRSDWDTDHGGRADWIAWITPIFEASLRAAKPGAHALVWAHPRTSHWTATALEDAGFQIRDIIHHVRANGRPKGLDVDRALRERGHDIPLTGRHTTLKGATEHWILARVPVVGTVVDTVHAYGTGSLNVGECLIDAPPPMLGYEPADREGPTGRWPTNFLLTHEKGCTEDGCARGCPVRELDQQSGVTRSGGPNFKRTSGSGRPGPTFAHGADHRPPGTPVLRYSDKGGASRFFPCFRYAPAASTVERDLGLDASNPHPTVKPLALMRWLLRLVAPPGGLVLDPFAGSGSTGCAAVLEGRRFVGIERQADHVATARRRINYWSGYR